MISMTSQRKQFNIVVSDLTRCNSLIGNYQDEIKMLLSELEKNGFSYFAMIHDKDMQNGVLKRAHLHIVLTSSKLKRAKQVLYIISDLFLCDDENIQIQECLDLVSSVQYLTHKNNDDKYRYMGEDIITNDFELFKTLYDTDNTKRVITTEILFSLIDSGMTLREIIAYIGIGNYLAYRNVIKDLKQ